jgi:hypothetical protein
MTVKVLGKTPEHQRSLYKKGYEAAKAKYADARI